MTSCSTTSWVCRVIVDTSALIAILLDEPEASACLKSLYPVSRRRISAANFLEAAIVIDGRRRPALSGRLDKLLEELQLIIEPVTEEQARIARQAYRDYGRGSGHTAELNFGDCFAYALARATGQPLLFKGNDFIHTDIEPALKETP
jgi:ribonuclease VapC